jgi:hypothetical protein
LSRFLAAAWTRVRSSPWPAVAFLAVFAMALWLPSLATPFWGDDYVFLHDAFRARIAGEPWWRPFWPETRYIFWRPLGHETYWRFVEDRLAADPWRAHALSFALWIVACGAVASFALAWSRALRWPRPHLGAVLAGSIYAALALHFTPLHWTSSADSLMVVACIAFGLAAWTSVGAPAGRVVVGARIAAVLAMQVAGLFAKESAAMMPLLMACIAAMSWKQRRVSSLQAACAFACGAIVAAWWVLRTGFVLPPPEEYVLAFGGNVLRNAACLAAWLFNVPREALRLMVLGDWTRGIAWSLAAAIPMGIFLALALRPLRDRVRGFQWIAMGLFVAFAYAPYFFLSWQSYEYYAQVAAIPVAIAAAAGLSRSPRPLIAVLFLALSSGIAVEGSRLREDPALLGRAQIGETALQEVAIEAALHGGVGDGASPIYTARSDYHGFYAVGTAGVAWWLARPESEVLLVPGCAEEVEMYFLFERRRVERNECPLELDDEDI